MKKILITMVAIGLCSFTTYLSAQTFNRTYELPVKRMQGISIALLTDTLEKEIVFVGYGTDTMNNPSGQYINTSILVKTDSNGVVLQTLRLDTTNAVERLMETHDNGFLHISQYIDRIEVTKFDAFLGQVWATSFPHPVTPFLGGIGHAYIDVERVFDATAPIGKQENYYIHYSTGSVDSTYLQNDFNICVLKLDELGQMVWHKIYWDTNRANYSSTAVRDFAFSITSYESPLHQQRVIALAGNRRILFPYNSYRLFTMLIDENGNPLTNFKTIATADTEPLDGSIMWDGDSLVMTYIEKNNSAFCPDPENVAGNGLLKFDENFTSFRGRYYWFECENAPTEITLAPDGNYMIGGWGGTCFTGPPSPFYPGLMLQKIERNSLTEIFYNRYNVDHQSFSGFHRTDASGNNYLIGSATINNANRSLGVIELIKTDSLGDVCGVERLSTEELIFTPVANNETFDYTEFHEQHLIELNWYGEILKEQDCSIDGDVKRMASPTRETALESISIDVLPTLMLQNQGTLKLRIESPDESILRVQIHNSLGQLIHQAKLLNNAGFNEFLLNANVLSKGLNMIQVYNSDVLLKTTKVIVN